MPFPIEPGVSVQTENIVRLHDERVSVPSAIGGSHPGAPKTLQVLFPIQEDSPHLVIVVEDHVDAVRRLKNLDTRVEVIDPRKGARHTVGVEAGIIYLLPGSPAPDSRSLDGPRQHRGFLFGEETG